MDVFALRDSVIGKYERFATSFTTNRAPDLCTKLIAVRQVPDLQRLNEVVRRAYQLSATLPDVLLREFELATLHLPRATDAERLVVQRVGQELFREGLLRYWEGRCAVTGIPERDLLRGSHIKLWADCTTEGERLDSNNGLLLVAHLDALFDKGFVTFRDDGLIVISSRLSEHTRALLNVHESMRVTRLTQSHCGYLDWHRTRVFRGN